MAKIYSKAIRDYIKKNGLRDYNEKGYELYITGCVQDVNISTNGNSIIARVQDRTIEKTSVYIMNNKKLITSCSCRFPIPNVICEHKVALLYWLAENKAAQSKSSFKPEIFPQVDRKRLSTLKEKEIQNYKTLTVGSAGYLKDKTVQMSHNAKTTLEEFNEELATLSYSDWYSDSILVNFFKSKEKLYITCSCNQETKGLCEHQSFVLETILNTLGVQFFENINPEFVKELKEKALTEFNLPKEKKYYDYFKIIFNGENLEAVAGDELRGLIKPNSGKKKYKTFIEEVTKDTNALALQDINKNYALGFYFHENASVDFDFFNLNAVTGKISKDKTKLINPIRDIEAHDAKKVEISAQANKLISQLVFFSEREINAALNRKGLKRTSDNKQIAAALAEHYFQYLDLIIETLSTYRYVFLRTAVNPYLSNMPQISISDYRPEAFFMVTEEDIFYNMQLAVKLPDKEVLITDENLLYIQPFLIVYQNVGYFLKSVKDDLLVIDNYNEKVQLRTVKQDFGVLYNDFIGPISQKHNIEFNTKTLKRKTIEAKDMKRQLYISEMGTFVLFKPHVLYNNDKLVNILENGRIFKYTNFTLTETERNFEYEKEFYRFIKDLHQKFEGQFSESFFHISFDEFVKNQWFLDLFEKLKKADVEVFGLKNLKNFKYSSHKAKVAVQISSGQDWFDLNVKVNFGNETVSLKDIKKAIVKRENFVKLSDGKLGVLPEEWIRKFETYFRQGQVRKDNLKISKLRFNIIDELFNEKDFFEIYKEIAEKKQALKEFTEIKNVRNPQKLKGKLRDYQKAGYNWLHFLDEFRWGGILADDMGLGKTIQVLAFLLKKSRQVKKASLIVLPTTLLFNWEKEISKFTPDLSYLFHYGTNRKKDTKEFKNYNLILTTYGTLTRDIEILRKYNFNYVILDESQAIKNPMSQRFKAVSLLKADNKLAMTGTPIENNTFDLYAQMDFLNPGFLGSQRQFKENYSDAIDREQNPEIAAELQNLINPFILRRTKEQVATELPPKTEDYLYCEMEDEQRKVYETFKNDYRKRLLEQIETEGMGKAKIAVLEGLTKLRQICDSPEILPGKENYGNESIKVKELIRHIKNKTGKHKILMFSQFVKMLSVLKRELKKEKIEFEYLDGQSSKRQREESVEHFQTDDACRVFLISLKAGGTGINLTAADYVYIIDPWWNPAVENQAIDRCYRIGQDKKVIAYRMICKNTIEEKIMKYQAKKQKIASDIITTDEGFVKNLDKGSIEDLFS